MKLLLTGAGGQLGRELQRRFNGSTMLAVTSRELDVTDSVAVMEQISRYRPDIVIHAAAFTRVDEAQSRPELAWRVNAFGAQNVAVACQEIGAAMVYLSTDYVFDGRLDRPYREVDIVNPLNVYGQSKYAGELLARQATDRLYILRTAWLYGDGTNFVRTMLQMAQQQTVIRVVDDQFGCPTSTLDLGEAIARLIQTGSYGTYHAVNEGVISWYLFARKIFALTGNTGVQVQAITTDQMGRPAPRPVYSALDTSLLQRILGWRMRSWEAALEEYLQTNGVLVESEELQ